MPQLEPDPPRIDVPQLAASPPNLHGDTTHGLVGGALEWIDRRPRPQRTLETGCGISTLVFIARGDEHICITPFGDEPDRVRAYCREHDLDAARTTFIIDRSEAVLPGLDVKPRDLVLIDGSHAFPQVFIDYFYSARLLAVGGVLVIDDVHLWTGKILRDFLATEPEWAPLDEWEGRTVAFEKTRELRECDWFDQPFVTRRSSPWQIRARIATALLARRDVKTLARYVRGMRRG